MKQIWLFLLLFFSMTAWGDDNPWSLRAAYGKADKSDLGEIISMQSEVHSAGTSAAGLEGGYRMVESAWGLPMDLYLKGGLNRFFENGHQDDFFELTLYFKLFLNFRPFDNTVRVGFGEGASYAFGTPYVEKLEAEDEGDRNSRFLNYLDISLDFDVGRLVRFAPLYETYLGFAIKHRSGIYGFINSVRRGGSNYNMFYIEHNF